MTVPGVNLIATAPFLAAIGEVSRFSQDLCLPMDGRPGSDR